MTEWRAVVGYEGYYEVSDEGSVRRIGRGKGSTVGMVLKHLMNSSHYPYVSLWRDRRRRARYVHLLVAAAFLGPKTEGQECNHKDGVKTNASVSNLEYVTRSENARHSYRIGLHARCVASFEIADAVREMVKTRSRQEIATTFNISRAVVSRIVRNRAWVR